MPKHEIMQSILTLMKEEQERNHEVYMKMLTTLAETDRVLVLPEVEKIPSTPTIELPVEEIAVEEVAQIEIEDAAPIVEETKEEIEEVVAPAKLPIIKQPVVKERKNRRQTGRPASSFEMKSSLVLSIMNEQAGNTIHAKELVTEINKKGMNLSRNHVQNLLYIMKTKDMVKKAAHVGTGYWMAAE
jgi:hypothetical protein